MFGYKTQSHISTFKSTFCQNSVTHPTGTTQVLWLLLTSIFSSLLSYSPKSITTINGKLKTHHCQHHQRPQNGKKKSQPKENPNISYTHKKKKISNYQNHHQPHKPTSITTQASNHNYKHRKPKHTKIFKLVIQNCQPKPTNTENPNPNPGILKSKTKITKMRSGFLFRGIYLCVDEHGEWV